MVHAERDTRCCRRSPQRAASGPSSRLALRNELRGDDVRRQLRLLLRHESDSRLRRTVILEFSERGDQCRPGGVCTCTWQCGPASSAEVACYPQALTTFSAKRSFACELGALPERAVAGPRHDHQLRAGNLLREWRGKGAGVRRDRPARFPWSSPAKSAPTQSSPVGPHHLTDDQLEDGLLGAREHAEDLAPSGVATQAHYFAVASRVQTRPALARGARWPQRDEAGGGARRQERLLSCPIADRTTLRCPGSSRGELLKNKRDRRMRLDHLVAN